MVEKRKRRWLKYGLIVLVIYLIPYSYMAYYLLANPGQGSMGLSMVYGFSSIPLSLLFGKAAIALSLSGTLGEIIFLTAGPIQYFLIGALIGKITDRVKDKQKQP